MIQKVEPISSKDFSGGLNTISDFFALKDNETPDLMNVKCNFDGSLEKRSGYVKRNSATIFGTSSMIYGMADYGLATNNYLLIAGGTGVVHSTDLGATVTAIQTSKTASRTHFFRSKDWLLYTDDAYDRPYYWGGSSGVQMVQAVSMPTCRFGGDFQGFGFLMNHTDNTLRAYYQDNNSLITGPWNNYFTLPAEKKDLITGNIVMNNKFYISCKYKIFRVTYVGGNPDFAYTEVKNFGFVPGCFDKVSIPETGEVVVGLCYDKRIRVFDGSEDKVISDKVETDNKICDFALTKLQDNVLELSNSVVDTNEQVWKLNLALTPSNHPTHTLCLNLRTLGWHVYSPSSSLLKMLMIESANKTYLVGGGSDGNLYQMDTSNTDNGIAINDKYCSRFIFDTEPIKVTKAQQQTFFFAPTSANNVTIEDRVNFDTQWTLRDTFNIPLITTANQIKRTMDIPMTFNSYQYKISSSSGTSDAWKLNRVDGLFKSRGYGS